MLANNKNDSDRKNLEMQLKSRTLRLSVPAITGQGAHKPERAGKSGEAFKATRGHQGARPGPASAGVERAAESMTNRTDSGPSLRLSLRTLNAPVGRSRYTGAGSAPCAFFIRYDGRLCFPLSSCLFLKNKSTPPRSCCSGPGPHPRLHG